MGLTISSAGIALIKQFEGCRLTAYKAVSTETYYTIGYGHYGSDVTKGMTITKAKADSLLVSDLAKFVSYVNNAAKGFNPNQNQFDALVSFTYNCGAGNLASLLGNGSRTAAQVSVKLLAYNKSGGKVLSGLTKRRAAEQVLFNTSVSSDSPAASTSASTDYSKVFDAYYYMNKYPDVKAECGSDSAKLLSHFVNFGMKEARQAISTFDVLTYRNNYADLRKAFDTVQGKLTYSDLPKYYLHYISNGAEEGRKAY